MTIVSVAYSSMEAESGERESEFSELRQRSPTKLAGTGINILKTLEPSKEKLQQLYHKQKEWLVPIKKKFIKIFPGLLSLQSSGFRSSPYSRAVNSYNIPVLCILSLKESGNLRVRFRVLLLLSGSPPSVNYGWSYFHMDSPTDKNPPDSGLLLMDSPTDKSCGLRTADCGLRTTSVNYGWSYG